MPIPPNPSVPPAYRPCVGMMVLNPDNLVLVGQRRDVSTTLPHTWQMPQGGIEDGETPWVAGLRELGEETGIRADLVQRVAESADWRQYDLPPDLAGRLWGGRFRGQRQKWFAVRFLGTDADVNIETAVPEFRAWKWAPITEVPKLIIPFKFQLYDEVVAEFRTRLGL